MAKTVDNFNISFLGADPPTLVQMTECAGRIAVAMKQRYGSKYRFGQSRDILYPSSGTSKDYMYQVYKVPLSWTWELRDTGQHAFLLPEDEIEPAYLEFRDGIVELIKYILYDFKDMS